MLVDIPTVIGICRFEVGIYLKFRVQTNFQYSYYIAEFLRNVTPLFCSSPCVTEWNISTSRLKNSKFIGLFNHELYV